MAAEKIDIQNENFDLFFYKVAAALTPGQKDALPKQILYKLHTKKAEVTSKKTNKLTFLERLMVLWKGVGYNWYIVLEAPDGNGLSIEEYVRLRDKMKKRARVEDRDVQDFTTSGTFVTASKELAEAFTASYQVSISPLYRFLNRIKNMAPSKTSIWKEQMSYIAAFLCNYEAKKKRMCMEQDMIMAEVMVLLAMYHGKPMKLTSIYKEIYRYNFHASRTKIIKAFQSLQRKSYITKVGTTKNAEFRISPLGSNKLDEMTDKYLVKF